MSEEYDDYDDEPMATLGEASQALRDAERIYVQEKLQEDAWKAVVANQPLYVIDSEKIILGSILLRPEKTFDEIDEIGLSESHFHRQQHAAIFKAMSTMRDEGEKINVVSVVDLLNKQKLLEECGGAAAISQLEALLPASMQVASSAKLIVEKSDLRLIALVAAQALERAKHGHDSEEIIEEMQSSLSATSTGGSMEFSDNIVATTEALALMPALNGGIIPGLSTGFLDVDALFRFREGDLIIIAGRPSMGKTQFILDCMLDAAVIHGEECAFFSLEMSAEELMSRLIASKAGLNVIRKSIPRHEIAQIQGAAGQLSTSPIHIDDKSVTMARIKAKCKKLNKKKKLRLIVIDYLQLLSIPSNENRAAAFGDISRDMKLLARELECPVVALSQLNRGVEARTDKRPMMSDLRESGAIEQDADVIAFLYREEYYSKDMTPVELQGVGELIVAKHRKGPTGIVRLRFEKTVPRFRNLARGYP